MTEKRLTRSSDRMLFGVASGVAKYLNIDPTLVRLAFVLFTLLGGPGVIAYIILLLVMPEDDLIGQANAFTPDEVIMKDKM